MKNDSRASDMVVVGDVSTEGRVGEKRFFTMPELLKITGLTRKQLTYWSKTKLLSATFRQTPPRAGLPTSFYSFEEVVKALVISYLKRKKFPLQQIRRVIRNLESQGVRLDASRSFLLTDGYSVYYAYAETEVVDILKHHGQMLLLVPLHEQVERLKEVA
jgi:DNA-binding transcriptional MerR regulator